MLTKLPIGPTVLLLLLALAACSGVSVTPNPTYPGYVGNNGPGSGNWTSGPGVTVTK